MPLMLLLTFSTVVRVPALLSMWAFYCTSYVCILPSPLLVGKVIQTYSQRVREIVKKRKITMKLLSSFLLVMVPWMKVSTSVEK